MSTIPAAPAPVYERPARNPLGVAALITTLVALVALPIAGFIVGFIGTMTGPQQTKDTVGWAVLGGLVSAGFGFAVAGAVCLIAAVLAIVALTRKGRGKVAAIIALVLAAPIGVVGTLLLFPYFGLVS